MKARDTENSGSFGSNGRVENAMDFNVLCPQEEGVAQAELLMKENVLPLRFHLSAYDDGDEDMHINVNYLGIRSELADALRLVANSKGNLPKNRVKKGKLRPLEEMSNVKHAHQAPHYWEEAKAAVAEAITQIGRMWNQLSL
ncbi:MAG: hypothetical protein FRX48_08152 [Lasallia pustulata]|uniref:Uncharacterized protein n=1 Tax=Lasallia pustulata TaxID=136370 RepID=A0A5M8PER8_9LECA|nr:MAG: hypothetical protein FRX48_08152 [Lasallia pustulata]